METLVWLLKPCLIISPLAFVLLSQTILLLLKMYFFFLFFFFLSSFLFFIWHFGFLFWLSPLFSFYFHFSLNILIQVTFQLQGGLATTKPLYVWYTKLFLNESNNVYFEHINTIFPVNGLFHLSLDVDTGTLLIINHY